jgi:UDP-N-acetylglucosamine 2-epimerase (non-hydrolysing)
MVFFPGQGAIIVKRNKKWLIVAGARPNFMKIAPLMHAMKEHNNSNNAIVPVLIHTGQHYDKSLSEIFFDELGIPEPDINLGIGSGSHGEQTGKIMIAFEKVLIDQKPDLVIVAGDVNSTIACALVAVKLSIPVAHVEAGLRSFDRTMPEEINRILTDRISDFLFTPSRDADENLTREGIPADRIFFVGNIMVDSLKMILQHTHKSGIFSALDGILTGNNNDYALLTLHRPSNVDNREILERELISFKKISENIPVLFPVHPRTMKNIYDFGLSEMITWLDNNYKMLHVNKSKVYGLNPLGYLDFVALMSKSKVVLTDSGGVQEESTVLGIPCITLRENTERPITVREGTNTIVGSDPEKITAAVESAIANKYKPVMPELWDGKTAHRIFDILLSGSDLSKIGRPVRLNAS